MKNFYIKTVRSSRSMMSHFNLLLIILISLTLTSCALFEGIFRAGLGIGILVAVVVIGLIIFIATRFTRR
jgi:uncharacterized integral membrane protein